MGKDTFRGFLCGIVLTVVIGCGAVYLVDLNNRVKGIEKFLNNAIQQSQQRQPQAMPAPEMKK